MSKAKQIGGRRTACATVGAVACLVGVGCGGATSARTERAEHIETRSSVVHRTSPKADAHRFMIVARAFGFRQAKAADEATRAEQGIESRCTALSGPLPEDVQKQIDFLSLTWRDALLHQSLARPYAQLATSLRRIRASDPALRAVATSVAQIAAEMQKFNGVDTNFCHYFDQWKSMQWDPQFGQKLRDPWFRIFGLDRARVVGASRRSTNTIPRLERLGLTFTQAVKTASLAAILGT